ncbi:tol-pal system-associated acyl-CoA thioesterase [Azospirillum sp. TSH58]|uniref:tol-pal system-associated acyl-CoA thioesterase n=1 Tax=Azospirillum sp. TSH58 TaxID=664962 RepID=UPI000D602A21|nr:tol-pal system-associated acyl-CoA thioesterase [Azospirillum sp. TSH58]AWJ84944.1 tol-pal system-associated acyl-CoA thioesterase [Azospirillum sp. TSH58]PWC71188.1 acyl-CoA thioester hydrolase [Azospirillum sp. TSH58]
MPDGLGTANLSGWFDENAQHRLVLRVYYEDTDAGGLVYHANYLRFFERARTEMLRLTGFTNAGLAESDGVSFAVRRAEIDFVAPAKLEDTLEVVTRITDTGGASFAVAQLVRRDGRDLARAVIQLAMINLAGDRAGRPARLPAPVREALIDLYKRQKRD